MRACDHDHAESAEESLRPRADVRGSGPVDGVRTRAHVPVSDQDARIWREAVANADRIMGAGPSPKQSERSATTALATSPASGGRRSASGFAVGDLHREEEEEAEE